MLTPRRNRPRADVDPARGRTRRDRGSATLELAILTPALLLLMFGVIQAALFFSARNVVSSAAQVGLDAVRIETGSVSAGTAAARTYINQVGGTAAGLTVSGDRTTTTASVTVAMDPPVLLPGLPLPRITASANAPVEAFLP